MHCIAVATPFTPEALQKASDVDIIDNQYIVDPPEKLQEVVLKKFDSL
jgi:hypothetical protein